MKLIGFLMVTVDFLAAALATVLDENAIRWLWYVPALIVGVAGVATVRMNDVRQSKTKHHVVVSIETVEGSLERISSNVKKLNAIKHSINPDFGIIDYVLCRSTNSDFEREIQDN